MANFVAVLVGLTKKKLALLINLSTITRMFSFPALDLDKPSTKSMKTKSHFHVENSKDCKSPMDFRCSASTCWHMKHLFAHANIIFHSFPKEASLHTLVHYSTTRMNSKLRTMTFVQDFLLNASYSKNIQPSSLSKSTSFVHLLTYRPSAMILNFRRLALSTWNGSFLCLLAILSMKADRTSKHYNIWKLYSN